MGDEPSRRNAGGGGRFSVSSQTFSPRSSLRDEEGPVITVDVRLVGGGGLVTCCMDALRAINVAAAPGTFQVFSF